MNSMERYIDKDGKYHYVYKLVGKKGTIAEGYYYTGKHSQDESQPDTYWGSGARLKEMFPHNRAELFDKEIVAYFKTAQEAFNSEDRAIKQAEIDNDTEHCLNLKAGGGVDLTHGITVTHIQVYSDLYYCEYDTDQGAWAYNANNRIKECIERPDKNFPRLYDVRVSIMWETPYDDKEREKIVNIHFEANTYLEGVSQSVENFYRRELSKPLSTKVGLVTLVNQRINEITEDCKNRLAKDKRLTLTNRHIKDRKLEVRRMVYQMSKYS